MSAQDTANHILIDLDAESQRDLLSDARAASIGIAPLHGYDGVAEFSVRSFRTGSTPALGRKQHAVLAFPQQAVQMEQGGELQNDGGTEDAGRSYDKGEQTGGNTIRGAQVGCTLAPPIEDQQLMPEQHRFGHDGPKSTWPRQPRQGDDQMNEQDDEVAHPGNGNNTSQATIFRPIWQFAIDTPADMLAGRQQEIHAARNRKLEEARRQRQLRCQQAA